MTTDQRFTIFDHLVVQTFFVRRRPTEEPHYEIQLAQDDGPKTPRLIYVTNDPAIYEAALALEGSDQRVDVAWKPGCRRDGRTAQMLVAMREHREAA